MSEYQQGKDMAQCLARLDRIEAALSSYHDESPPSERTSPLFDGEAELTAVLGEDLLPIADRDILNLYRGFEFNDSVVRSVDPERLPDEAFGADTETGRSERRRNSYILIYDRNNLYNERNVRV